MENTKGLDNFINSTLGLGHGYLAKMLELEEERQDRNIELIASENYASEAVRLAMASCLTNKYAEGYSGNRFYGGCEYIDKIEDCCKQTWQRVFNTDYSVNVQPHSGTQANLAVYNALLKPGDTIFSLDLNSGGHLSHGSSANLSGKIYKRIAYSVNEDGYIDMDHIFSVILHEMPKLIIVGASAYPRQINFKQIKDIIDTYRPKFNIYLMADIAHIAGLVAGGCHMNPVPYADIVTSTTHKTLRGPRGGIILTNNEEIAKKVNKAIFPGTQGGPLMHVIAAKAVCFNEALSDEFKEYQKQLVKNCEYLCDILKQKGYVMVSGGTDNHLFTINVKKSLGITGKIAEETLDKIGITCNKNTIPYDTEKPNVASGIRIGTAAVTTRGFKEKEIEKVAYFIDEALHHYNDEEYLEKLHKEEMNFMEKF